MMNIESSKVVPVDKYPETLKAKERDCFVELLGEARAELNFYDWCKGIVESYIGIYLEGIIGVFLFKIQPSTTDVDEWIWVIVGDVPPLYITSESSPNAACALDSYIGAMEEWVEAVEKGLPVDELVPVEVPATKENAHQLKIRLTMLDENVLSQYEGDLEA